MLPSRLVHRFLYFPLPFLIGAPDDLELAYEDVHLTTADGVQLHGWWLPRQDPLATLYFLHGNAGNISHRLEMVRRLHEAGFQLFILDYRGYGRSRGRPSETGTYEDALAGWRWLQEREEEEAPIILYGRSLGGAVAAWLAVQKGVEPDGVILESTFTRLREMARIAIPLPGLEKLIPDMYPTIERIGRIRAPVLLIHGRADEVIPFAHVQDLFAAATEPKFLYAIPQAGHNDTILVGGADYQERLRRFAQEDVASARLQNANH